jgi:hypothetical protein
MMTAADIAEQDSHVSDSAVEQHCSAKLPSQAPLHWRLAYADAGLDSAALALGWQGVPVDFVLHRLRSVRSVPRKRAHGKRDRSTWVAHEAADTAVEKTVHKVEELAEHTGMVVVVTVVVGVHKAELEEARRKEAKSCAPFAWLG